MHLHAQRRARHGEVGELLLNAGRKPRGGSGAQPVQHGREFRGITRHGVTFGGEGIATGMVRREGCQGAPGCGGAAQHLIGARPVPARQRGVLLQALLHPLEPARLGAQVVCIAAHADEGLLQGRLARGEIVAHRAEGWIQLRCIPHRPHGATGSRDRATVSCPISIQQGDGQRRDLGEAPGVHQPLAFGPERLLLGRIGGHPIDVGHERFPCTALGLRALAARTGILHPARQHAQVAPEGGQAGGGRHRLGADECIEDRELGGRPDQPPLVVLPGEPHECRHERRHAIAGGHLAIHQRTRPPLGGHPPGHHDLLGVVREFADLQGRVVIVQCVPEAIGHRDDGLHEGVRRPRAHRARVGLRTRQQAQRLGHHGLARPRFARDGRQPRRGLDVRPLDHHQVPDLDLADHAGWAPGFMAARTSPGTGGRTRTRGRSRGEPPRPRGPR